MTNVGFFVHGKLYKIIIWKAYTLVWRVLETVLSGENAIQNNVGHPLLFFFLCWMHFCQNNVASVGASWGWFTSLVRICVCVSMHAYPSSASCLCYCKVKRNFICQLCSLTQYGLSQPPLSFSLPAIYTASLVCVWHVCVYWKVRISKVPILCAWVCLCGCVCTYCKAKINEAPISYSVALTSWVRLWPLSFIDWDMKIKRERFLLVSGYSPLFCVLCTCHEHCTYIWCV